MTRWRPHGVPSRGRGARPEVGDLVAYDYRAWQVMHVKDVDPTPEEADRLDGYVQPYRDQMRPYAVTLRRVHGPAHEWENSAGDVGLRVHAGAYDPFPVYPHGRVPLCSCHGHPWPCQEADQQAQAEREMAKTEREMKLLPGCCPACQEPVTERQRRIVFPGPYVRNPFLVDPAFHLRRKCRSEAAHYEDAWVAADPTRPRSLLTLRCTGTVVVHHDGTGECFGAEGSDCPSLFARHRAYTACYLQSHGCPRDCPRVGHPGTGLAGHPSDPRAV